MADPQPPAAGPGERRVDLTRVVRRLTEQVGAQAQENAMLAALVEEQDELIAGLRAELVQSSRGDTPDGAPAAADSGRQ